MKTFTLVILIVLCFSSLNGMAQIVPSDQLNGPSTTVKTQSPFLAEWKQGARWAIYTTLGTAAVITGVFLLAGTNEAAAYISIPIGLISIGALPFLVGYGVNKTGRLYDPDGKAWMAFVGGLAGTAALLGLEFMVLNRGFNFILVFPIYALGAFALIPAASALTYNLFGGRNKSAGSGALLNFHRGSFGIGAPVPVVYPNPFMQGKICSQISLLKVTF